MAKGDITGIDPKIDLETTCELFDKIIIENLRLMEEKMKLELAIEYSVNDGSYHLAKSRYISGQNSVSATKLPTENSAEFTASVVCKTENRNGLNTTSIFENCSKENIINPLNWFGLLVPQNLVKAKKIFQNSISLIVDCVNIQFQISENLKNLTILRNYKKYLKSS